MNLDVVGLGKQAEESQGYADITIVEVNTVLRMV